MKKSVLKLALVVTTLVITPYLQAAIVHIYESVNINEGDSYGTLQIHQSTDVPPIQTVVNMYGGQISTLNPIDSSVVNIYGGAISSSLAISYTSTVNVYGGSFSEVGIDSGAILNIYGYRFKIEPVSGGAHTLLTGYWLDGTEFSMLFYRKDTLPEQVNLLPEPTMLLLFGVGGLVLRNRRLRRH